MSKPEIEQIRGVNSNEVVNSLIDKNLVKIVGRSQALGKPLLFGTTNDFLRVMGLKDLEELPKLRELEDLMNFDKYNINSDKTLTLNIEAAESKLEAAESKLEAAESKLEATESKLEATESKLEATESKLEATESTIEATESKLEATESKEDK